MASAIPERLTTQASAARYFAVHERTIFRWIDAGLITGYQDGAHVLVDLDEIERRIASNSRMKDGRRPRFSEAATIVPVSPRRVRVEAEPETSR
jgi:excisionase family DNA binding protein